MGLVLSTNVCEGSDCGSLIFSETTGLYNAETNPTGYGAPNPSTSDIVSAELVITLANGTSYTIDLFATGDFPTTNTAFEYEILPTDIGYNSDNDQIEDQIITFVYTITTNTAVKYTQTVVQAFYCQVECCVNRMFLELDLDCDCIKDEMDEALKAYAMLQGLKAAVNCGNNTAYTNILAQLTKLCGTNGCSSCN